MQARSIAFNRPDASGQLAPCARPIDLDHLARQTMGQKEIEAEVLRLFLRQVRECMRNIVITRGPERAGIAHTLKGSARGVGAFALAERAEKLEADPDQPALVDDVSMVVVDVENFLLGLSR